MKTAVIRSSWMAGYGYRLDCSPYLGGALEAKQLLEKLPLRKDKLHTLTAGFGDGIFNGPQFVRNYVESPEHGVPFMTGSTMQLADLTTLPLLSKHDARSRKLSHLELQPGMSLISCSGTIGKMAYVRRDMIRIWSSQDALKVVADPAKISSGYLYAYLCSKFGIPLVASGTYGAIIQHLEPEHIVDLPVPRLGNTLELRIHALVEEAADLRSRASELKADSIAELEEFVGLAHIPWSACPVRSGHSAVLATRLEARLDPHFFSPTHTEARSAIERCRTGAASVSSFSSGVVEPTRFKRVEIEQSASSVGLYGSAAILNVDPQASYHVPRLSSLSEYLVDSKTILIPRSGSLNGIIGTACLPIGDVVGGLVTEDAIRVFSKSNETAGFLYLALSSVYGIRQLKCRAYGSAIPHLDVVQIGRVLVPNLSENDRNRIGQKGFAVGDLWSVAIQRERKAIRLIETALEEGA